MALYLHRADTETGAGRDVIGSLITSPVLAQSTNHTNNTPPTNHTNNIPIPIIPTTLPYQSYQQHSHTNHTNNTPIPIIPTTLPYQSYKQHSPTNHTNNTPIPIIQTTLPYQSYQQHSWLSPQCLPHHRLRKTLNFQDIEINE